MNQFNIVQTCKDVEFKTKEYIHKDEIMMRQRAKLV